MADTERHSRVIGVVKWPIIILGFWSRPAFKNSFINKVFHLFSIAIHVHWIILLSLLFGELLRLIVQGYSKELIFLSFSVLYSAIKYSIKLIIGLKNHVTDMLVDVEDKEKDIWKKNDDDIKNVYLKNIKMGELFGLIQIVLLVPVIPGVTVQGTAELIQLRRYNEAHNTTLEPHAPYQFWFPGDKLAHMPLITTLNSTFLFTACVFCISSTMLIIPILVSCSTHLAILQYRLRHYIPEKFKDDQMNETVLFLKSLISEHQHLIEFVQKTNQRCKNIIMVDFVMTSFDIALTVTAFAEAEGSQLIVPIFAFGLLTMQICFISWFCNELQFQSHGVADAAYESKWYLLNKEGKVLTQIIMARAQRPLYMTIGPFGPMTTQSFLMIMKAAYSYVSVMRK